MSGTATERVGPDDRSRQFQLKTAGLSALIGATLLIVSNVLQRRADIPRGNPLGVLEYINERPWFAAAFVGVLATLSWVAVFGTIGRTLKDDVSRSIARMAEPVLIVAVAVFAVSYAHDGLSSGVIARRWAAGELAPDKAVSDARVVENLVGGTSILCQSILSLALLVYAVAMLNSGQYSRILCWFGIVGTAGWFLGAAALFMQIPGTSFELFLPFAVLATAWVISVGVALIRRTR